MPVTRKSTRSRGGAAAAAAQGKQQTLSFHHRVTKPTVKTGKDLVVKEEEAPETVTKTKTKDIKVKDDVTEVPEAESHSEEEEKEHDEKKKKKKQPHAKVKKPAKKAATKHVVKEHVKEHVKVEEEKEEEVPKRSEIELCALEIPQSAIDAYWNKIDSARMASAVHKKHTQDLTTGEKVLRYFDVSSHYGPCIGITRLKRWQRAEKLGLNPPLEVLAVLLKEGEGEEKVKERAHMDELLNSVSTGP